ncbi:hypothetical protein [Dyella sp. RRB7]|uniref:hypothetical protein n=1 Tax=Dyella sp. RRB7 TaxID=2919502 RepID=UPI001FA9E3F8|nr:hypothetical protein [Dyella sp. RRB7]
MVTPTEPTAEGHKRYPQTNGYNAELPHPIACTCQPTCWPRCAGECGCEACSAHFLKFCDDAGLASDTGEVPAEALAAYRRAPHDVHYGEYKGIRYAHRYDIVGDHRTGVVHLPLGPKTIEAAGGGTDSWLKKARDLIEALYRERPDQLDIHDND